MVKPTQPSRSSEDKAPARPDGGVPARQGTGEGSRTALARMIEEEKARGRTRPPPDDDAPPSAGGE